MIFCACATAAFAVSGLAGTVPAPFASGSINGNGLTGIKDYAAGNSTLIMTSLPGVSLTGHTGSGNGDVSVTFDYFFNLTGGTFLDSVPLLVDGVLRADSLGGGSGDVTQALLRDGIC